MSVNFGKHQVVVPGELLAVGRKFRIGTGTFREGENVLASAVGLADLNGDVIEVIALEGGYFPKIDDDVIGKIVNVTLSSWRVDIKSPYYATLQASNFLKKRTDVVMDDLRRYLDMGDAVFAKIIEFDRTTAPLLTAKEKGLGKLKGGTIIDVMPAKIPRLIGRRGSMINMIIEETKCRVLVGQNGRVWISGERFEVEDLVVKIIRRVEREAHTAGLTDRIRDMIRIEMANKGVSKS
ncbi:MAG: exosome complex RNA-binding protein Rrp4 [Candidatus Atabeyarchaeum deiterrae]